MAAIDSHANLTESFFHLGRDTPQYLTSASEVEN